MQSRRNDPGGMRDVCHQDRADLVCHLLERGEIQRAGVGASPRDDELGAVLLGQSPDLGHVNLLGGLVHAVGDYLEEAA